MKTPLLLVFAVTVMHAQSSFDTLVDRYFDDYFRLNPTAATAAGFHHPYDSQLEDYSARTTQERIAMYEKYLPEFEKAPASDDRDLMISHLKAGLLNVRNIRQQETTPDFYSSGITASIFSLMSRKFAPPEERLRDVIARERKIPEVFEAARQVLKNPPKIYTEVALEQLPGLQSFFADDVPQAFAAVKDPQLLAEFRKSNDDVIQCLKSYESWVRSDVLPRSNGDFRIGADNFRKKVAYEEMVDVPLDRLLQIGFDNLHENQRHLLEICKKNDANK